MKKTFTLLLASVLCSSLAMAQNFGIVLYENFDATTTPNGWTQSTDQTFPTGISTTTPSDGWAFGAGVYNSPYWDVPASIDGTPFAISNDDPVDQNRLQDQLMSPVLNLAHFDSAIFLYDVFYDSLYQASQGYFIISYDAGANWLNVPLTATTLAEGWVEDGIMLPRTITVSGTPYTFSDQMMIGFVHTDRGAWATGVAIDNVIVAGYNNPCDDIVTIPACGAPQTVTLAGQGIIDFNFEGACGFDVPGAEQLYSFTPTETGAHTLSITSTTEASYLDYMFKEASTGCDTLGWTCLGDVTTPDNFTLNLTAGTEYLILVDNEFADSETQTFSIECPVPPIDPCLTSADTWGDLNTAPCFDGACIPSDAGFSSFGLYGSETYTLQNVQAGYDYVFDMCSGVGAGSWIPEITIVAPDGTTIDAWNGEAATGSSLTFIDQCSLAWTATQSGEYKIIINELGTAAGDAPNQVDCNTSLAMDNGNPTVVCGTNPAPCPSCEAGTLTSPLVQDVCPGETFDIALNGNSTPSSYTLYFDNSTTGGTGGTGNPVSITGYSQGDFPMTMDADVNGTLSSNSLPPFEGSWEIKVIVVDAADAECDSTDAFTVNFLTASDPNCITVGIDESQAKAQVVVYPNPSNGSFTVEMEDVENSLTLTVMDVAGREIHTQTINGSGTVKQVLNLDLNAGSYLLKVTSGNKQYVNRIVIR